MIVIKADGCEVPFEITKLSKSITDAMKKGSGIHLPKIANIILEDFEEKYSKKDKIRSKDIYKFVISKLREYGQHMTAKAYEDYTSTKAYKKCEGIIDNDIKGIIDGSSDEITRENANKDSRLISTQRDLIAGAESRSYAARNIIPTDLYDAHKNGLIHIHDTDYLIHKGMFNCCNINLKDMLDHGTCINGKWIDPPKSFVTACTVATQISLQISNGQYGGQTMSMSHLAPYVRVSYNKHLEELDDLDIPQKEKERKAWELTRKDVKAGVQTIQFQENTFTSNNGQTPFVSLFLYLDEDPEYKKETAMIIEETLNLRMLGMKNKDGVYVTPAFPKLLFVLDEDNVPEDSEYHWLFKKAVECANRRSNPDFMSAKILKKNFDGNVFPVMGCRSALAAWKTEEGKYKFYGRFNRGVVSLNLVDVALTSGKDEEKFWRILDERLELAKSALLLKDSMLRDATSDVSPIHWQYGGIARLAPGEKINRLLDNGYSSISLGYVGVYEMTKYMTGKSNTDPQGKDFAMRVIDYLESKTIEWRSIPGLHGCSLYGTPAESLAGKFYRKSEERFGKIPDITDKEYFTNSYHVSVREHIDAFSKLSFEAEFQGKSKGGAVSYVEIPNMEDNLEALEEIVKHMYETIQYAELNTKAGDVCGKCGFTGTVEITEDGLYRCPKCGNIDQNELWVTRRVCGYLGSTTPCKSRMMDIRDRVEHI